jgi:hypothetical protein
MPEIPPTSEPAPESPPCQAVDYRGGPCPHDPVIVIQCGCVHEHLVERAVCQYHVEMLANNAMYCGYCRQADGHICEMVLLREVAGV